MPLSKGEIEELMREPILAHLAVVTEGKPHVSPIWVYYEDGLFYFTTRSGRVKGTAIRENPNVAVSIATNTPPYKALLIEGRAEVIQTDRWITIGKLVSKYVTAKYGKSEGEKMMESLRREPGRIAFLVRPTKLLSWNYGKGDYQRQGQGISMSTNI
jgi:PPOX class probable F420-dependent enzyme